MEHLRIVLGTLRQHELCAISKCDLCLVSVTFLGHIISKNGVSKDHNKVEAIMDCKRLSTVRKIRSFLSLAGYYRRFAQDFA